MAIAVATAAVGPAEPQASACVASARRACPFLTRKVCSARLTPHPFICTCCVRTEGGGVEASFTHLRAWRNAPRPTPHWQIARGSNWASTRCGMERLSCMAVGRPFICMPMCVRSELRSLM